MMLYRYLPLLGIMTTIFILSHSSGDHLPSGDYGLDKVCHLLAYAALAAAFLHALPPGFREGRFRLTAVVTVLFCLVYGISDEFHQSFIAGRMSSWQDLLADAAGAALLVLIWRWWRGWRRSRGGGGRLDLGPPA